MNPVKQQGDLFLFIGGVTQLDSSPKAGTRPALSARNTPTFGSMLLEKALQLAFDLTPRPRVKEETINGRKVRRLARPIRGLPTALNSFGGKPNARQHNRNLPFQYSFSYSKNRGVVLLYKKNPHSPQMQVGCDVENLDRKLVSREKLLARLQGKNSLEHDIGYSSRARDLDSLSDADLVCSFSAQEAAIKAKGVGIAENLGSAKIRALTPALIPDLAARLPVVDLRFNTEKTIVVSGLCSQMQLVFKGQQEPQRFVLSVYRSNPSPHKMRIVTLPFNEVYSPLAHKA